MSERERFEAWCESAGYDTKRGFGRDDNYSFVETRRMWEAWQAACPEGWHEPTAIKIREMCEGMTGNQIRWTLDGALSAAPRPEDAE